MEKDDSSDEAMQRFEDLATKIFQADKPQKAEIEDEDETPDAPTEQE